MTSEITEPDYIDTAPSRDSLEAPVVDAPILRAIGDAQHAGKDPDFAVQLPAEPRSSSFSDVSHGPHRYPCRVAGSLERIWAVSDRFEAQTRIVKAESGIEYVAVPRGGLVAKLADVLEQSPGLPLRVAIRRFIARDEVTTDPSHFAEVGPRKGSPAFGWPARCGDETVRLEPENFGPVEIGTFVDEWGSRYIALRSGGVAALADVEQLPGSSLGEQRRAYEEAQVRAGAPEPSETRGMVEGSD